MSSKPYSCEILCRLCGTTTGEAQDKGLNNLFDKRNATLVQQIKDLTGLNIRDMPRQKLPRRMCLKCGDDLRSAWEFRSKIIRTQNYFKSENYKMQLAQKPEFAFITLNEYECNEALETKSCLGDNLNSEDETMTADIVVETIIKQEIKDISAKNIENKTDKCTKLKRTRKKIKADQSYVDKYLTDKSSSASLDGTKDCVDNISDVELDCQNPYNSEDPNFTLNSDDTNTDNSVDDDDPDLFAKTPDTKPKKNDGNEMKTNEGPDILKDRQFHCHLCQCPLETLIQLKIHFQKQHKKEKIKCDLCDEKVPTIKSLVRHFRMHKGEKEHKCHYCDMTFKYSTIRCRHERRVHSKDAPFLCFMCGKTFITTTMGKDHMTVHTKERAHHCPVCKADFLRKSHLNTHYRSMTHKNNLQKLNDELSSVNSQQKANVEIPFEANN